MRIIEPIPGLPDMVFAANGALVIDGKVLGAQFAYPERAAEGPAYLTLVAPAGLRRPRPPGRSTRARATCRRGPCILAGTGFRTDPAAHAEVAELFGQPVISLRLVDPRFYHLDTALAVLDERHRGLLPAGVRAAAAGRCCARTSRTLIAARTTTPRCSA